MGNVMSGARYACEQVQRHILNSPPELMLAKLAYGTGTPPSAATRAISTSSFWIWQPDSTKLR